MVEQDQRVLSLLVYQCVYSPQDMAYACVRVCVRQSAFVISLVQRKLLRTCLPWPGIQIEIGNRNSNWNGIGIGFLGIGYWVLGRTPAATHPHLLSLTISRVLHPPPRCLAATSAPAAWQSEYQFPGP